MRDVLFWKGLLASERSRMRVLCFAAVLAFSVSMSFLQLGFVSVAPFGPRLCYAMGLLVPIVAASLLFGVWLGALEGLLAAVAMCVHAWLEPLNIVEKCLVFSMTPAFVALYTLAGFFSGVLFAMALRNEPRGVKRSLVLLAACVVPALAASIVFDGSVHAGSFDTFFTHADLGSPMAQVVCDLALMACATLACDAIAMRWYERRPYMSARTIVRSQMISVLAVVFVATLATCFVAITRADRNDAYRGMQSTLAYVRDQCLERWARADELEASGELGKLSQGMRQTIMDDVSVRSAVEEYSQDLGTLVIVKDGLVLCSNSEAYPTGEAFRDAFGQDATEFVTSLARSSSMEQTLMVNASDKAELAYACADAIREDSYVLMERGFSSVFDQRRETMAGATLVALVMIAVTYLLGSRLLQRVLMGPIQRTNDSLEQIVQGDLNVIVSETGSVEFSSLSAEINQTVDTLKGWIDEAERRMESELAAARAIQESALPKTFPSIPDAFELYASMVPAREVGGDFYDFFALNDHTIGFLVADVSGKGIPAALFMMRAKNELATRMKSGIDLVDAIALTNEHLCEGNDALTFVTVWAATFDWHTGTLTFVNAGHNEPLLLHNGRWEWLRESDGPLMGFSELATFASRTLTLGANDELLLFTDGVTEAMNTDRKLYGEGRLEELVNAHAELAPRDLDDAIRADVAAWAAGAVQSDDITILTFRVL
ncbi:MAG: SpoIIE family protein phosphatase [Coriobacteriales bacterium]|nr:SpoIIE family protein phosphatase [Coriobacteriales bacterium]